MARQIAIRILLGVVSSVPAMVYAQSLPTYLEGDAHTAVRIEVDFPEDAEVVTGGLWNALWRTLAIRARVSDRPKVGTKFIVFSNAYASSPYQTDGSPCVTSSGTRVRPGVVASNFLPMGTLLEINGNEYIVEDRMNVRYQGNYIDVWFPSTSEALAWGGKRAEVTVMGYAKPGKPMRESQEDKEIVIAEVKTSFLEQLQNGFDNIGSLLGARKNTEFVNRFDVDCLE